MPPEYAMQGHFSLKSDVYSFGILLLEILSGKKNGSFCTSDPSENLLSHAWKHWNGGTSLELLDLTIRDSYSRTEVNKCIHIALLCVQENPAQRPTMDSIILMLNSNSVTLSSPQRPAFFLQSGTEQNKSIGESRAATRGSGAATRGFHSQSRIEAVPTYSDHSCPNTSTFTINTPYQSNLNHLLAYLSSNATRNIEFYNATASASTTSPVDDTVYGLYLCRGDMSPDVCRACVAGATKDLIGRCPVEKVAVGWYEECMLRYSNRYIFSSMASDPADYNWDLLNVSEPGRFDQLVQATMNGLATKLSNVNTGAKKFGTREATFSAFETLYTLAQCTPDLSGADCYRCLKIAIASLPSCCSGKKLGLVQTPSCNVKYALSPFYQIPSEQLDPESPITPKGKGQISLQTIVVIVASISVSAMLFVTGYCYLRRKQKKKYNVNQEENATDKFSDDNKLGQGGFGVVYKGILSNGQEIAVKRLSQNSRQGSKEFKNEVVMVAKLQHRNLVRLLGFCLEKEEKILVYEFVPNKSLDYFLCDPKRREQLDWSTRYKIIKGIARGILYLHEDSRLRVIHRDLKASNILLDQDMNPKISDFSMAKIFGVDQTQGNTNRIVGTFGYMSPEYAMFGQFSLKSDVYSLGVLILEIISGQKNSSSCQENSAEDLLSYAWKHWRDETPLELLDPTLGDSYARNEVIRSLHIGLHCVQDNPADRPTMATVVLTLNSDFVTLPLPQRPAFFFRSRTEDNKRSNEQESNQSTSKSISCSVNEASNTELYPR
ncbi:hypothetical protein ACJW31_05G201100 [Castanea mollissima]